MARYVLLYLFTPSSGQSKSSRKILNFLFFSNPAKQKVPHKSTAKEVSFEWSHDRISSTDSKVRTTSTLHVFIIDSRSERVKKKTSVFYKGNVNDRFDNLQASMLGLFLRRLLYCTRKTNQDTIC